jgi:hypothetical protein
MIELIENMLSSMVPESRSWIQYLLHHVIFYCAYSTLTDVRWAHRHGHAWAGVCSVNSRDSHAGEGMLNYNITLSLLYHLSFMIRLLEEVRV